MNVSLIKIVLASESFLRSSPPRCCLPVLLINDDLKSRLALLVREFVFYFSRIGPFVLLENLTKVVWTCHLRTGLGSDV